MFAYFLLVYGVTAAFFTDKNEMDGLFIEAYQKMDSIIIKPIPRVINDASKQQLGKPSSYISSFTFTSKAANTSHASETNVPPTWGHVIPSTLSKVEISRMLSVIKQNHRNWKLEMNYIEPIAWGKKYVAFDNVFIVSFSCCCSIIIT
jgi:hypothetical protein